MEVNSYRISYFKIRRRNSANNPLKLENFNPTDF